MNTNATKIFRHQVLTYVLAFVGMVVIASNTFAANRVTIIHSGPTHFEMRVEAYDITIEPVRARSESMVRIELDGETGSIVPGAPDVPHISRLIAVPPATPIGLSWEAEPPRIVTDVKSTLVSSSVIGIEIDDNLVENLPVNDGFWPPNVVEMEDPAIMRGNRIVRITVNPVQVNLQTGELRIWEDIRVKLDYTAGDVINPILNPNKSRPSSSAGRLIRSLVSNPNDLRRDEGVVDGTHLYIVPDFEGVAEAIEPLADWRRRKGYPTVVIVVEEDASNVDVRREILTAYEEWEFPPDVVTLVGDADLELADFMIPTWDVGRAYMWETDYKYATLEGDDLLPELAIGRISCRNLAELRRVVNKIITYETAPNMEEPEWFTSAALMSNDQRTGYSSIYVQRWARKLLQEIGFAEIDTFYFIHDNEVTGEDFIRRNFNNGISIFNYRGWGQFNGDWVPDDARRLRNVGKWPLIIMPTCNTADFADHLQFDHSYAEEFVWADGGAIGAIGSSGFTHTNYNNVLDGGIINGIYRDLNWQVGWALNQGKLEMYRHFGAYNDIQDPQVPSLRVWEAIVYQTNLIGDAATELWTGEPFELTIRHPAELPTGENILTITAVDPNEEPVSGVLVTLLREGEIFRKEITNAEGKIHFVFEQEEMVDGVLDLTGTKHNVIPYLGEVEIVMTSLYVAVSSVIIDDDQAGSSNGNDDGLTSPGERIELRTFISNFGDEAAEGELEVELSLIEGDVDLIVDHIELDAAPELGDSALATFVVDIGQVCSNGSSVKFIVTVVSDDDSWVSSIESLIAAPDIEVAGVSYDPEVFDPGDTVWVDVTLRNIGDLNSTEFEARLVSGREEIAVFRDRADVDPIQIEGEDSLASARFRFYPHDLTIPGTDVEMFVIFQNEQGFCDSTGFSFAVGSPEDGTPFGPDAYGYGCFDDTDSEGWPEIAPEYDWIEIDPDLDGEGTDTEIEDLGNEQDWSVLVDFPDGFGFRYYGVDFERITICSNGWIAFGDESKLADFQNRRIPPALGPRAQVCAFWDDLVSYVDERDNRIGGVYYWYDEENHRFIIEWSRMHRYIGMEEAEIRRGGMNTFQIVLYDPQYYQTYSGDGDIVLQYETVNNDREVDPLEFDTPYATVGIVNLNGTDGMEYTFWNEYHQGAAILEDRRAIKFSTRLVAVVGGVTGVVIDTETNEPIFGAEVRGSKGAFAVTDENGRYIMDNVLIGDEYYFTAWAAGYNDSTLIGPDGEGFSILEGDTLSLSFSLLHPEFMLSTESFDFEMQTDHEAVASLKLTNDGNGQLTFRSYFDYPENDDNQLWHRLLDFNASVSSGDTRINGVNYFDGRLWVTGSNNNMSPNYFYRYNKQGQFIDKVEQPDRSSFGFRGTTVRDGVLYGGEGGWIFGVSSDGDVVDSIAGPLQIQRALTFESHRDSIHFWVANGPDDPLVRIDQDGEIVAEYHHELDIYGLGWMPDDLDGFPLYILSRNKTNPSLQVPEALVSKFNPTTHELRSVTPLEADLEARAGGMEIVNNFDSRKWVMLTVLNHPDGDRVAVYDLGPNTSWVTYEPRFGQLDPESELDINFVVRSTGLENGNYDLVLKYIHNAEGLQSEIPIHLNVDPSNGIKYEAGIPLEFGLRQNYPNPFNSRTIVPFSLTEASHTVVALYDITGRKVAVLMESRLQAGNHYVEFDAAELVSGVYLIKLESGENTAYKKMALIR